MKCIFLALTTNQLLLSDTYAKYIKKSYSNDISSIEIISVGLNLRSKLPCAEYQMHVIPDLNRSFYLRVWQRLFYGGHLFFLSFLQSVAKNVSYLFVFNDNEPITNKFIKKVLQYNPACKVIIIEEGVGIYSEQVQRKKSIKQFGRIIITSLLGSPMLYKAIGDNERIKYAIVGNPELYKSLKKSKNQIVYKQSKDNVFRNSYDFVTRYYNMSIERDEVDAVYLGQPYSEYGDLTKEENDYLIWMFEKMLKGRKVIIKPHPRDKIDKYMKFVNEHVSLVNSEVAKIPMECLVQAYHPKLIISHASSAGVNIANTYHQICSIFTYKTGHTPIIMNNRNLKYDDAIYVGENNNTFIPTSENELTEKLCEIFSQSHEDEIRADDLQYHFLEIDHVFKD